MESQSFLQKFKVVFQQLQSEGILTPEDIKRGVEIPLICFNIKSPKGQRDSRMNRRTIEYDLRQIHTKGYYPLRQFDLEYFKRNSKLIYSEKDGVPYLESYLEYSVKSGEKHQKNLRRLFPINI